eukprot:5261524-Pleurochrysis_carterae.AAC.1
MEARRAFLFRVVLIRPCASVAAAAAAMAAGFVCSSASSSFVSASRAFLFAEAGSATHGVAECSINSAPAPSVSRASITPALASDAYRHHKAAQSVCRRPQSETAAVAGAPLDVHRLTHGL